MEGEQGSSNPKLRTSRDIYNRLKWDSTSLDIDLSSVYIGYKDRFLGMCELPFTSFSPMSQGAEVTTPESDLPYHRIYYFRSGGPPILPMLGKEGELRVREENWPPGSVFYWDRESRRDLIFGSGRGQLNIRASATNSNSNSSHPFYKFDSVGQRWEAFSNDSNDVPPSHPGFKLLTFNILHDLYDSEALQPSIRWPALIAFLQTRKADIIALQEVTSSFLSLLEKEEWVQKDYFLTEISSKATTLQSSSYGQIFLTKFPPQRFIFKNQKEEKTRVAIATFVLNDKLFHIANIHLPSDCKGDRQKLRQTNMRSVIGMLALLDSSSESDVLIVGDTNFGMSESIDSSQSTLQFADVWESLVGSEADPGITFDIANNLLAKTQSRSNRQARFDRIFVKTNNTFKPVRIEVVGKSSFRKCPEDPDSPLLWLSDHYALECEFRANTPSIPSQSQMANTKPSLSIIPVYTSAVVIIPPESVWPLVQSIRSEWDPSFPRWPPHITLLFRFVPDSDTNFELAAQKVTSALKTCTPFPCNLSQLGMFQHSKSTTVFLAPDPEAVVSIASLYYKLAELFPNCPRSEQDLLFTPHLTIAKLETESGTDLDRNNKLVQKWEQDIGDIPELSFRVDKICFLSRSGDNPFTIRKEIFFRNEPEEEFLYLQTFLRENKILPSDKEKEESTSQVCGELNRVCNLVLAKIQNGESINITEESLVENLCQVHLTGSTFLGIEDDSSDLDFVVLGPSNNNISHSTFFTNLEAGFTTNPTFEEGGLVLKSVVLSTTIPIARLSYRERIDIDLVYSECPNPWSISELELSSMSETPLRCINAIREGHKLLEIVPSSLHPLFRVLVRSLKYWARQRNIYTNTIGFLGSTQIAIMVAFIIVQDGGRLLRSSEDLLCSFFATFAKFEWPKPLQFHEGKYYYKLGKPFPELMPILSPSFPYLNRQVNVTRSTRALIQKEIRRGDEIMSDGLLSFSQRFGNLVEKQRFLGSYEKYLRVNVSCDDNHNDNDDDLSIETAVGILKSGKLLSLVVGLEQSCRHLVVHPSPEFYRDQDLGHKQSFVFLGLSFEGRGSERGSRDDHDLSFLSSPIQEFRSKFRKWTEKYCDRTVNMEITMVDSKSPTFPSFLDT